MKRMVGGKKDENGIYEPKPKAQEPVVDPTVAPNDPLFKDISLDDLTRKQLLILYRETRNLLVESTKGLLPAAASQSFERCMKMTKDLRKEEKEYLDTLTDEQLETIGK